MLTIAEFTRVVFVFSVYVCCFFFGRRMCNGRCRLRAQATSVHMSNVDRLAVASNIKLFDTRKFVGFICIASAHGEATVKKWKVLPPTIDQAPTPSTTIQTKETKKKSISIKKTFAFIYFLKVRRSGPELHSGGNRRSCFSSPISMHRTRSVRLILVSILATNSVSCQSNRNAINQIDKSRAHNKTGEIAIG